MATLALATLAAQRRAAAMIAARADAAETERIAEVVLGEELRAGVSGRDHAAAAGDSLRLRAFRGVGLVCPGTVGEAVALEVRYSGVRLPEPAKDSALVLGTDLRWRAAALQARTAAADSCPPVGEWPAERWTLDPPPGNAVVARIFESGVYALQDHALRYRRGLGGRQPLTPELLRDEGSGITGGWPAPVRIELRVANPLLQGRDRRTELTVWPRERLP